MNWWITGTDTEVGKTYVTAGLVRAARTAGHDAAGWKPICCGERSDAEQLCEAGGGVATLNEVNPVWFRAPVSPYAASLIENRAVDLSLLRESVQTLTARHAMVLAEGAGGWEVPILREFAFSDLAAELGWPVLVVAANRLGTLNHTLLTVKAIQARGLVCAGVVLNDLTPPEPTDLARTTNREVLASLVNIPVWELGFGGSPELTWLSPKGSA